MPPSPCPPDSPIQLPAAGRGRLPFDGLVLLCVEDSRFAAEALRLLCRHSGCRMRRADTLQAARAHLAAYRPDAVIVDPGLPDGSGLGLIRELRAAVGAPPALVLSGDPDLGPAALEAGARAFLAKPVDSLARFQQALLDLLPALPDPPAEAPGPQPPPDPLALRDDLRLAAELAARLAAQPRPDAAEAAYLGNFLKGLARISRDPALAQAARQPLHEPKALRRLDALLCARIGAASPL
ncbi:MAG: Response regulator receiver protein [Cereibacter sp.]|nr:Response regulator receiver protein [Cereibacter sp.]